MGSDWEILQLKDAGVTLIDCVHKTPPDAGKGVPYIAIPQMKEGRIDFSANPRLINHEHYIEWTNKAKPQHNDIVLSRRCNPGETAYVPPEVEFALGQNLVLLRSDGSKVQPAFLRWLVRSRDWWEQVGKFINVGAVFDSLKCAEIPKFEIPIPPLPEQQAIAHILGSLDDRIELNRRMNGTLEAMAQALFKSWFVDFDPVIDNALASGKEIPAELSEKAQARAALGDNCKPLPEETRTLFPDEFTYSDELGWIPEGWEVKPIDEALEVNPRVRLKKGEVAKFVDMKALPTSGFSVADVITKPYSGGAKFNNGDVLLARITPCLENGKTGVADFLDDREVGFGSTEFIVLRGKGAIHTPFVACLARHANFRDHCTQSMVGSSGRQRVQNACFSYFYLALPLENDLLSVFNELAEGTFEKYVQQRKQSKVLSNLRNTLLPKLLSGELRIPDAEKMVEELAL